MHSDKLDLVQGTLDVKSGLTQLAEQKSYWTRLLAVLRRVLSTEVGE